MREAATRSHKNAAFHQMPKWLLDRIQEQREVAGLPKLNATGIPNDSPRFSAKQRLVNKRMIEKHENENAVDRVRRLAKATKQLRKRN